ncbi:hypothetical protein FOCC_FOCC000252, partial [Frankliniella occidentalis]
MHQKLLELENIVDEMNTQILCISEHWLKPEQIPTSNISGFKCASIFCRKQFSHGGVAIYVRNGYHKFKELDVSDIVSEKVFEAVCIICDKYAVICVYRSPSGDINDFCDKLDECIQRVNTKKNQILICGDFNIDILDYQNSVDLNGKKLVAILQENGLHTITNKSTRVTNVSRSAIDHIITNFNCKQYESKCDIETGISDHYMQCISVNNLPQSKSETQFIMKRVFTIKSKAAFCRAIKDQNWEQVYCETDVNNKFNVFHNTFKNIYDTHFPIKKVKERESNNKSWVTNGIKITSKNYRDLCALMKTTNDAILQNYFKKYKSLYKQVIKKAKCLHNQRTVLNSENKCKTIWSVINSNIGKSKQEHKNMNIRRTEDSPIVENPDTVSNMFNDYYLNIIEDLQKNNLGNGTTTTKPINSSMYLGSVSTNEVISAIGKLKNKQCSGPDDVTDEILKLCHKDIGSVLGPLLFIIFINDLVEYISSGHFINFADDTNLIVWADTMDELEENLKRSIEDMTKWCNSNKLILNESKTSLVQFRTNFRTELHCNSMYFNSFTPSTKFLGIFIDDNLKWTQHIEELESKLNRAIFAIRKIRDIIDVKTAIITYHALFHSLLSYGVTTWGGSPRTIDIFKQQKRAIRAIMKLPQRQSCRDYFK